MTSPLDDEDWEALENGAILDLYERVMALEERVDELDEWKERQDAEKESPRPGRIERSTRLRGAVAGD